MSPLRYYAYSTDRLLRGWAILDSLSEERPVDIVRTVGKALYDVNLLNSGTAQIDPHALLGCRVTPRVPA